MRVGDTSQLGKAFRDVVSLLVFGLLPAVVVIAVLGWTYSGHTFLSDFHGDLYRAGHDILSGENPYRASFLAQLAAVARAGGHPSTTFAVPVYPAPDLLLAVPLALLPYHAAGIVFTVLGIAALLAGFRLLGVRDWRCYGAALLSWPVVHTLRLGQVNEFLILGLAVVWRWRLSPIVSACGVAAVVVAKVFLWPIELFLLLTRRWRAAWLALAVGAATLIAAWAVIGFDGFVSYPRMLSDLSAVEAKAGISLPSFAAAAGLGGGVADALMAVTTVGLILLAWVVLKRDQGERSAFGLLVMAGLTSSSLVWPHYLSLLFVPIALLAPTLNALWLVPLLAYLAPVELTSGHLGRIAVYLGIEVIIAVALCRPLLGPRHQFTPAPEEPTPVGSKEAAGRLAHGLIPTPFRSYIAPQRPTKGS